MKMTHIVYYKSGERQSYHFGNKTDSERAKHNGIYLAQVFGQIVKIEIFATNNILNYEIIDFPQNYK